MSTSSGITFNQRHTYHDFGLTVASRDIGYPSKIKVTERVPYSNIVYDFSEVYGGQEYEERQLTYVCNVFDPSYIRENYFALKDAIVNWLCNVSGKIILKDDKIPGYYFLAEVINGPSAADRIASGQITIIFNAYPFKISELEEGHDIWDSFNFLLDYAQPVDFKVNGTMDVTLYNPGANKIRPLIIATNSMEIIKDGVTYNVPTGESSSDDFSLNLGENNLKIIGNGEISFRFRKEIL